MRLQNKAYPLIALFDINELDSDGDAGLLPGLVDATKASLAQLSHSLVQHVEVLAGAYQPHHAALDS